MKERKPYTPAEYSADDVAAIQALVAGVANEGQQRTAVAWIITKAGAAYDQSYFSGPGGDRDTAFAEGRRFVANSILKLSKLPVDVVRKQDEIPK
jgi:uncharacterized protein YycO